MGFPRTDEDDGPTARNRNPMQGLPRSGCGLGDVIGNQDICAQDVITILASRNFAAHWYALRFGRKKTGVRISRGFTWLERTLRSRFFHSGFWEFRISVYV